MKLNQIMEKMIMETISLESEPIEAISWYNIGWNLANLGNMKTQ